MQTLKSYFLVIISVKFSGCRSAILKCLLGGKDGGGSDIC